MSAVGARLTRGWMRVGTRFLPFADAATLELPLGRLLRLSLFQVSVGMVTVLLIGTLNRVMIIEMGVQTWLVALMVGLPLFVAPLRAFIGFRSDHHRSVLGWRRVPYLWMGSLLQFGGLAIMPFALIVLSGDTHGPAIFGQAGAALAFLLVGAGMQTAQTAGLALATDLAPAAVRPRVVALLYVMLLAGMVAGGLTLGLLLETFSQLRLIKVVQGSAMLTLLLNGIALWKQEARNPALAAQSGPIAPFRESWARFLGHQHAPRFLIAVGLGTAAFCMQEVVIEPYGAQVLGLNVSATTVLTALLAFGSLCAFALAARLLGGGMDPHKLAAIGALIGIPAFSAVIFAAPLSSPLLFRAGTTCIGFGAGLFSVGTLACAMSRERDGETGLALGAWGAVQATAMGLSIAAGGLIRDVIAGLAAHGVLGTAMSGPETSYGVVYHIEIALLFAALVAIGPLVKGARRVEPGSSSAFGIAGLPG
ncbi:MAG TPA: BCD family MFS transporter [Steroidobacteraceae bacterium]|nr:BCD family MFS transporter [Steroidobacteraceae bacterium]